MSEKRAAGCFYAVKECEYGPTAGLNLAGLRRFPHRLSSSPSTLSFHAPGRPAGMLRGREISSAVNPPPRAKASARSCAGGSCGELIVRAVHATTALRDYASGAGTACLDAHVLPCLEHPFHSPQLLSPAVLPGRGSAPLLFLARISPPLHANLGLTLPAVLLAASPKDVRAAHVRMRVLFIGRRSVLPCQVWFIPDHRPRSSSAFLPVAQPCVSARTPAGLAIICCVAVPVHYRVPSQNAYRIVARAARRQTWHSCLSAVRYATASLSRFRPRLVCTRLDFLSRQRARESGRLGSARRPVQPGL